MSKKKPSNLVASVRDKLLSISHKWRKDYQLILTSYAIERLLYRLSVSSYSKEFLFKGARLSPTATGEIFGLSRYLDLLGCGKYSEPKLKMIFKEICLKKVGPDGLEFDQDSIIVTEIREDQAEYQGKRINLDARLGKARIKVPVDVTFGGAKKSDIHEEDFPVILKGFPVPRIRVAEMYGKYATEKDREIIGRGLPNDSQKEEILQELEDAARCLDNPSILTKHYVIWDHMVHDLTNLLEQKNLDLMKVGISYEAELYMECLQQWGEDNAFPGTEAITNFSKMLVCCPLPPPDIDETTLRPTQKELIKAANQADQVVERIMQRLYRRSGKTKKGVEDRATISESQQEELIKATHQTNQVAPSLYLFRKDGDVWQIIFDGRNLGSLKNCLGLGYIHFLLQNPCKWHNAWGIQNSVEGSPVPDGLLSSDQAELNGLNESVHEARKAAGRVDKAINRAVRSIHKKDSLLGEHLKRNILKKTFECNYNPSSRPAWKLE